MKRLEHLAPALIVVAVTLVVQVVTGAVIMFWLPAWPDRGDFGSMFGVVSSLFSGLALAGVVYAILLQRQELALQRHELELTRTELARTAKAQEETAELLQKQLALATETKQAEETRRHLESAAQFAAPHCGFEGRPAETEMRLTMKNFGPPVRDLHVFDPGAAKHTRVEPAHLVPTGAEVSIVAVYGQKPVDVQFGIEYSDKYGQRRRVWLVYGSERNQLELRFSNDTAS